MAVKQNNTETNANASPSGTNSASATSGASGGGVQANVQVNITVVDDSGGSNDTACAAAQCQSPKSNIIEFLEQREQEMLTQVTDIRSFYQNLLVELSHVPSPRNHLHSASERQRFRENIVRIGEFFAKSNDKNLYRFYLLFVWQMMTKTDDGPMPSCAVAIVFNLFEKEVIYDAVQMLLEHKISDAAIRQAVRLLCNWVAECTFCQNLHLWIINIVGVLTAQKKFPLVEDIVTDHIESVFSNLEIPVLREKLFSLVVCFLYVVRTPRAFHRILPKVHKLFKSLKQQLIAFPDAKETLQSLTYLIDNLMLHFPGYNELYKPVEDLLNEDVMNGLVTSTRMQRPTAFLNNKKAGLVNLGNTCYMNSVLQALANTKEFSRHILLCETTSPLIVKVQEQIALMLYSRRDELTPTLVWDATRPASFSPGCQQDSSEFLNYLLEALHDQETVYRKGGKTIAIEAAASVAAACAKVMPNDCADKFDNGGAALPSVPKTESSSVEKTFTGKQATTVTCLTCGNKSKNVDIFRDLQLSFPEIKNDCVSNYSVQDLLEFYCSPEQLVGENMYYCEYCKQLRDAERSVHIINAPKNLIITLKHFKYDQEHHRRAKLMHKVFHDEKVYVKVCAVDTLTDIASVHYDLYASVVHSGYSMDQGHYYTFASDNKNWYKFDDSVVTPSEAEELHNLREPNTPYILFYEMVARSPENIDGVNNTSNASGGNQVINVEVPQQLALEELPCSLRSHVHNDNSAYNEELRRTKKTATVKYGASAGITRTNRRQNGEDDDDDGGPSMPNCGGNALGFNANRFVC